MLMKDVCTPDVVTCGPQTSALEAARLMRKKHVGDLVVVDDPAEERKVLGIVTDRDLDVEVLGNGLDPGKTTLGKLLQGPVVVANEREDRTTVIERMNKHGVRRLPVVDDEDTVVGIITLDDLLRLCVADAAALLEVMAKGQARERRSRR